MHPSRLVLAAVVLVPLLACGGPAATVHETRTLAAGTGQLRVEVQGVKVGQGTVYCALHDRAAEFPGASSLVGGNLRAVPTATSVRCDFAGLPAGTYAVSVYQDEDGDGALSTNFLGAPTEGYGASNNVLPAASAPTFPASSVALAAGATATLTVTLKH